MGGIVLVVSVPADGTMTAPGDDAPFQGSGCAMAIRYVDIEPRAGKANLAEALAPAAKPQC